MNDDRQMRPLKGIVPEEMAVIQAYITKTREWDKNDYRIELIEDNKSTLLAAVLHKIDGSEEAKNTRGSLKSFVVTLDRVSMRVTLERPLM